MIGNNQKLIENNENLPPLTVESMDGAIGYYARKAWGFEKITNSLSEKIKKLEEEKEGIEKKLNRALEKLNQKKE